uniref:Uncharacterized protein n=1 Tax=Ditylenchus dipsaci TaxID=166011 RepID=A0A915E2C2_9BILA
MTRIGNDRFENPRRSRFPYRFKHHTVNLLSGGTGVENRLISTDVLMDLQAEDEIHVSEIRRFWPPLRSLETMHDNLASQIDQFLERMMKTSTPLPSHLKNPVWDMDPQTSLDSRLKDTIKRLTQMHSVDFRLANGFMPSTLAELVTTRRALHPVPSAFFDLFAPLHIRPSAVQSRIKQSVLIKIFV